MSSGLSPRWASTPGATIQAALSEQEFGINRLATALEMGTTEVERLLAGRMPLTADVAAKLSTAIGGSTRFWLTREAEYVEDRIRVAADEWSRSLPLRHMQSRGWIADRADWQERIEECLNFFGVGDFEEWQARYGNQIASANYRNSAAFKNDDNATLVWFRAGERVIETLDVRGRFDSGRLEREIPAMKRLTRIPDPERFLPELQARCGRAGLAVVVVRAPEGCRASGATRWVDGKPVVQLSARHLTDDHLWFTFFHELGHVLNHGAQRESFIDLDIDAEEPEDDALEQEANEFAARVIWGESSTRVEELVGGHSRDVIRLAASLEVSPGVLVGQLQHRGLIGHNRWNGLKRRYVWVGERLIRR